MLSALHALSRSREVAVLATDCDGRVTWANPANQTLTGYTEDELRGKKPGPVLQCARTDPAVVRKISEAIRDRRGVTADLLNRHKSGTEYWVRIQIIPSFDENHQHAGFISVQSDITAEVESLQFALSSRTRLISRFSHELRTPLHALIQLSELLSATRLSVEQAELCRHMSASSQSMLALVNEVLDGAKANHMADLGPLRPTQISELFDRITSIAKASYLSGPVTFQAELPPLLPAFTLHGERLFRVLLNLVTNALKYTARGEVRLSLEVRRVVRPGATWELRFAVKDTGIGMSTEQLSQLLHPFRRVHDEAALPASGSGLGLVLCDDALREMGSHLQVHSTPGQGSVFWFSLHADTAKLDALREQDLGEVRLDGVRILLVDDNPIGLMAGAKQLRRLGAEVVECADGISAIKKVEQSAAHRFDVVLMDLNMPDIDGLQATQRIKALQGRSHLPVLAVTASELAEYERQAQAVGMAGFITKPFELRAAAATILRCVNSAGASTTKF